MRRQYSCISGFCGCLDCIKCHPENREAESMELEIEAYHWRKELVEEVSDETPLQVELRDSPY